MRDPFVALVLALAACSAAMASLWLVQRRTGNAGIVDVAWASLTGLAGLFYAALPGGVSWLRLMVAVMIGVWSLRLTGYLFRRVVGNPEEGRYATLRQQWGAHTSRRFFWFFQMQAIAAWAFAAPIWAISQSPAPPAAWLTGLAAALWAVGIGGVAVADLQLVRFKQQRASQGRTCRRGLWRYSRHPNYFFEWVHWCAYIPLAAASPWWWVPIAIAATLLYLVLFVTGIPPTEAQALASRGDDYRDYQRATSAFVPWFRRSL